MGQDRSTLQALELLIPPTETDMLREFSCWAERVELAVTEQASLFRIFSWDRVVDALLRLRLRLVGCLAPATIVLQIQEYGGIVLEVCNGGLAASCTRLEDYHDRLDTADVVWCDPRVAMRLLFGPLPPYAVMPLPAVVAGALSSWC